MFESVTPAPPDAIFGLNEAMRLDPRAEKINLGAGVYKDEQGRTPVLAAVKEAERRLLTGQTSKSYLPIDGHPSYDEAVQRLVLGDDHPAVKDRRAATVHTPGGTGALRVTADLLRRLGGGDTIWLTKPTWANHGAIFEAAGLRTADLPYYDPATHGLAYEALVESLSQVAPGDMVVLHACCHNPTGVDPTLEQWAGIADALDGRGALLLVDFAYQGFVNGVDEDAAAVRMLAERLPELVVCSSFSKNLGLYAERTGSMTAITASAEKAAAVLSQTKKAVRTNYSNPPVHGSAIVTEILADAELRSQWVAELATMRDRIQAMRVRLAEALDARGVHLGPGGNGFMVEQNGMFSFSGLSKDEVLRLREEHAIYMVDSGRLNVAGITDDNLDRLCDAIAAVRRVPATV